MKAAEILLCAAVFLPRAGSAPPHSFSKSNLDTRLEEYRQVLRAGRYLEASTLFERGYRDARAAGEVLLAARFLGNLGTCRFALHQYDEALAAFRDAGRLAEQAGSAQVAGALDVNISSLYARLGDLEAAVLWAERAQGRLMGRQAPHLPRLLIHLATLRARQQRWEEAMELFRRGIEGAEGLGDLDAVATGWERLGEEFLGRGEVSRAEEAMLEAYRLRKLHKLPALDASFRNLGRLRLAQGDILSASALLEEGVERLRRSPGLIPNWELLHARGRARLAQGRLAGAWEDLRAAELLARLWRVAVPPADATRVSAEGTLDDLYSALIQAGNRLYFERRRPALALETFAAAEENRAASLRALLSRPELPAQFWELLPQLQAAEGELLLRPSPQAGERVRRLRASLGEIESRNGLKWANLPDGWLERSRRALGKDAVFLSFHLAEPVSYLWALTEREFAVIRLEGRSRLAARVAIFEQSVRAGGDAGGSELYRALFGALPEGLRRRPRWFLALDGELFSAPLAALPVKREGGRVVYLAEDRVLQHTSGAALLARADWSKSLNAHFVGLGDAIYNGADPRCQRPRRRGFPWALWATGPGEDLGLARLPGTAREIAACARAWGAGAPVLLTGREASKERLRAALGRQPGVVHVAAHVLAASATPRDGLIVLSLGEKGLSEVLGPLEIGAWRARAGLVVLSGCSSGVADALPASGLMGLTRAWLAGGSGGVIASRWSTPDDDGALFRSFYGHLRRAREAGPALALQRAQSDMRAAGGWRASPRYWSAYFLMANQ